MARTFGAYEVLGELGSGGMGHVFRVRHLPTGEVRALKVLAAGTGLEAVERFWREVQALARLGVEGVVPLRDSGRVGGTAFYAMDLMPGGSLRTRIGREKPDWRRDAALVAKVARTLDRCHSVGLVHRDLKPENILLDAAGEPRVADWGCVRDQNATTLTASGTNPGTLVYMAPEQLDGERVDARADVYALGAILYELLTGRRPHEETSLVRLLTRIRSSALEPASGESDAPRALDLVLTQALSPERTRRFETAGELARALEEVLAGETDRRPWALAAGVFLGVAALGGLGALLLLGRGRGPATPDPRPTSAPRPALSPRPTNGPATAGSPRPAPGASPEDDRLVGKVEELLGSGRVKDALALLDDAVARGDRRAIVYGLRGSVWVKLDDLERAIDDFERATTVDPDDKVSWGLLANARLARNELEPALAACGHVVALVPDDPQGWLMRGQLRLEKRDHAGAVADLDRAIQLAPTLARAWSLRAVAKNWLHDLPGAIADATRAIDLGVGKLTEPWRIRGKAYMLTGEVERAQADLEHVVEVDPSDGSSLYNLGTLLARKADGPGALACFERAIAAEPRLAVGYYGRARIYADTGRLGQAIADYDRAIERAPSDTDYLLERGLLRRDVGDTAGARSDLERVLALAPTGERATKARELLATLGK